MVLGEYLILSGVCCGVGFTQAKRRAKYIIMQTDGHVFQVMLHNRYKNISEGVEIVLFVSEDTPIYEMDSVQILYAYLAIDIKGRAGLYERHG
jgi:hypothetical protein